MQHSESHPRAAEIRLQALAALFAYLGIDPQHYRPLVLFTRFEAEASAECSDGFYVTVDSAPYEVYRLLTGAYDVESSGDLSPTYAACPAEEKKRQFACAVALHAHGLTFREASEVMALLSAPPGGAGRLPSARVENTQPAGTSRCAPADVEVSFEQRGQLLHWLHAPGPLLSHDAVLSTVLRFTTSRENLQGGNSGS